MARALLLLLISALLTGEVTDGQVTVTDVGTICPKADAGDTAVFPWSYDLGGGTLRQIQWVKLPSTVLLDWTLGTTTTVEPRASTNGSAAYLLLSGVTAGDAGNYRCQVTMTDLSFGEDVAELKMASGPQNLTCPTDKTVNVKDSFSLQCSSDDEVCPSVQYDWKWHPNSADTINSTSGTLMIEGVKSSKTNTTWTYTCTASNTVGFKTCRTTVTVQCPPETEEPSDPIVNVTFDKLYRSQRLDVTVNAIPEATIIWTLRGSEIKRSSEQFLDVTAAGRYTCTAENILGSASCKDFNVTVTIHLLVTVIVVPTGTGVVIIIIVVVVVVRKKKRRGTMMSSSSTRPGENNRDEPAEPQRQSETNRPISSLHGNNTSKSDVPLGFMIREGSPMKVKLDPIVLDNKNQAGKKEKKKKKRKKINHVHASAEDLKPEGLEDAVTNP